MSPYTKPKPAKKKTKKRKSGTRTTNGNGTRTTRKNGRRIKPQPLSEAIEQFERAHRGKLVSIDRYITSLQLYARSLPGNISLVLAMSSGRIEDFLSRRAEEASYATVARDRAAIRRLAAWSGGEGYARLVFNEVPSYGKKRKRRDRVLSLEEMSRLREVAGVEWAPYKFVLYTGLRPSEVERLQVRDLDFGRGVVRVPESKSASGVREVPIPKAQEGFFRSLVAYREAHESLFHVSKGQLSRRFTELRKEAGLENITMRDLRRTHAQLFLAAGGDLFYLRDQLGHSSVKTTEVYAGASSAESRQDAASRAAELMGA